ncbi:MAG: hypothetical protein HY321_20750, partial [Armatimonadetes bacterium]|nr:hypothetical protein [Armatimonadota bacterium]
QAILDEGFAANAAPEVAADGLNGVDPGCVAFLEELRPGAIVKDDAVPAILRQVRQATFVTINVSDFWTRIAADRCYCVVCLAVRDERIHTVPGLLRALLREDGFRTKAQRVGKVVLMSGGHVRYYECARPHTAEPG